MITSLFEGDQRSKRQVVHYNEIPGVMVECIPWSEETEVSNIQRFDIGIMPLLDSPWERGKCGYKLIQYMAAARPVVPPRGPPMRHVVRACCLAALLAWPGPGRCQEQPALKEVRALQELVQQGRLTPQEAEKAIELVRKMSQAMP